MMRKTISITIDDELLDAIDLLRGDIPRSVYMERMLFGAVDEKKKREEVFGYA